MSASRTPAGLLAALLLARRLCAPRIRVFEAAVTTNRRQRAANHGRLRRLTAEHPEIEVFCAHDPAPLAGRPTARAVG